MNKKLITFILLLIIGVAGCDTPTAPLSISTTTPIVIATKSPTVVTLSPEPIIIPTPTDTPIVINTTTPMPIQTVIPVVIESPIITNSLTPTPIIDLPIVQPIILITPIPTPVITVAPIISTPSPMPTSELFSAQDNYPTGFWTPFASNSIWNQLLASDSSVIPDPNSNTYNSYYGNTYGWFDQINFGYFPSQENQNWNPPIYFSKSSDPILKVKCTQIWFSCPTGLFHIPTYAISEKTSDGHIEIVDNSQTPAIILDGWGVTNIDFKNKLITGQVFGTGLINGNGLNFNATAGGYALSAGILTSNDIISGLPINHALFVIAPCTSNSPSVYPSIPRTTDSLCPNNGGIKYGQRGRLIATQSELLSWGLTPIEYNIAMSMINYGFYQGDTNGGYSWNIEVENDYTFTQFAYTNSQCPLNGSSCTPLTAWENINGNPDFKNSFYQFNLSKIPFATHIQWLLPPKE